MQDKGELKIKKLAIWAKKNLQLNKNWKDKIVCKGMSIDLFYPKSGRYSGSSVSKALGFCKACPSRKDCLIFGTISTDVIKYGFYGGFSPLDRQRLIRELYIDFKKNEDTVDYDIIDTWIESSKQNKNNIEIVSNILINDME